jgi:predicted ATPase/DNA-binding SARP family transcriptional activator
VSETPVAQPAIQVYTLGQFRVLVGGQLVADQAWRRRSARQLFKFLLSRPGRRATRDEVVDIFWPDSDPDAASSNLRSTLYALRRVLQPPTGTPGVDVVFTDHDSIWLRPDVELWTDADAFLKAVAEALRAADPLLLLEAASASYAGDYLPDDLSFTWTSERREVLKRAWIDLQFALAAAADKHADVDAVARPLERLLRADACDERAARELMKLMARSGRRAEALRIYQQLLESLREELNIDPSPESVALYQQISSTATSASAIKAETFVCSYPFPTPDQLINREAELGKLLDVVRQGRTAGRVALLTAPAGTGKSALLGEVVRRAQAEDTLCLAGGCYEERGALPFGPFHDALVDFLLAQPPESLRTQLGSSLEDLAQVIPELRYQLQLSSSQTASPVDRMRAFGAIHSCLRGLVERGPVLVCLEDLHAADDATLQLLHYLARQTQRHPLVLIATFRSDEAPIDQPLAQSVEALIRERLAQRVNLAPLDHEDTDRLVAARLDGKPSTALSESLFQTTGGNPLFVEQLLLALEESGQLERKGGIWHGNAELQGTPHIVREVIAQRLQRLNPVCREVLAVAAVLGQSFEHKVLLAAVEPLHETTLLHEVDRAITSQVLVDVAGGYAFRHALVRDAVYWGLSAPRRMLLHGRAGELLEQFYGPRADDFSAELAHHFAHAGDSAKTRAKVLRYSLIAGRRAAQVSSYPQALDHFSRAWQSIQQDSFPDVDLELEVLQGRGWAEAQLARWQETVATYRRALNLAKDPVARARAHGLIAFAFQHMGDLATVVEECNSGLGEVSGIQGGDAMAARIQLQQLLAATLHWQGRYHQLIQTGEAMLEEAAQDGHPRLLMMCRAVIAWGFWGLGQVEEATVHVNQAISASEQIGEKLQIATSYENLGLIDYAGGRFADARVHLGRALALFAESATELRAVNSLQTLCRVLVAEGECRQAREQLIQALPLEVESGERWAADGYCILGIIESLGAEWDSAAEHFEHAIQLRRNAGHRAGAVEATLGLGFVLQQTGRWGEAATTYTDAAFIAAEMDPSPPRVAVARYQGQLQLLIGNTAPAAVHLEEALRLASSMPESIEYAPSLLAMGHLRAAQHELDVAIDFARESLDRARQLQHQAEANIALANFFLKGGDADASSRHAAAALGQATTLRCPWLVSAAHLAQAEAGAVLTPATAPDLFMLALRLARESKSPHLQAIVLSAFARYLQDSNPGAADVTSMRSEAEDIRQQLGRSLSITRPVPGSTPGSSQLSTSPEGSTGTSLAR